MTLAATQQELVSALQWYIDHGVDECVDDAAIDRFDMPAAPVSIPQMMPPAGQGMQSVSAGQNTPAQETFLGKSDAYDEAVKLAKSAKTLEELSQIIQEFDGIALKKTATNMVFADGNPKAHVMIIGDAPGADEDRIGKPFVGVNGQLLDRILKCINLDRSEEDPKNSVYISNILNWRPPGNRTPSPAEVAVSLPFIERHIQLVKPSILVLCGGVAAKSLLGNSDSISRLRKKWHDYVPQTPDMCDAASKIPAIATYHTTSLLRTPIQKRLVWDDMLTLQAKCKSL